jgi:hypothetical protein
MEQNMAVIVHAIHSDRSHALIAANTGYIWPELGKKLLIDLAAAVFHAEN